LKRASVLTVFLISSLILASMFAPPIMAQPPTMYVNPASITKQVGETFTIAVAVAYVENIWAWQFTLGFNASLVEVLNVIEGEFLMSSGPTLWHPPTIDNVGGTVTARAERTPPPPTGSGGAGNLAYIELRCKGPGSSALHLFNTFLWRPGMIPTSHVTVDGTVNQVSPPPQSLPLGMAEDVNVSEYGTSETRLSINVPPSPLSDMYRQVLGAPTNATPEQPMPIPATMKVPETINLGENVTAEALNVTEMEIPVREEFYKSIAQEQEFLLGFRTYIYDSFMVPNGSGNEVRVYLSATSELQIINITKVDPSNPYSDEIWETYIGPLDDYAIANATAVATSYALSKIAFVQQMLGYLAGNQMFDSLWVVNVRLPEKSTLLNGAYLTGLSWSINFGGGTYMNASVSLGGPKHVVLTERTFITEQNVTASPEYFFEIFSTYKKFKIEYQLPFQGGGGIGTSNVPLLKSVGPYGQASELYVPLQASAKASSQPASAINSDWSWTWSRTISPGSFTASLSYSVLSASLTVTPSLTISGYIGWEFKTQLWPPKVYTDWFKAYMSVTPSVTVTVTASASASKTWTWDKTLYTWSTTYSFMVGPVPVWVTFQFKVTFTFTVNAQGTLSWTVGQTISSTFKAGVKWTKSDGWSQIKEQSSSATKTGPTLSASASASITPEIKFQLAALFYSVAGPFIAFIPYATITITVLPSKTWSVALKFKITAGCTFADWLKSTLKLDDYSSTLFDWTLASWSGSW